MEKVIDQLLNKEFWKESMRKTCRNNKLNIDLITAYTPLRFRTAYYRFKAIYQRRTTEKAQRWLENQLKAFYWFMLALSCTLQINIQQFTQNQWALLIEVFSFKQPMTLEYQGKKLVQQSSIKQNWDPEEERLLTSIVLDFTESNNKWNQFARKLYEVSEKKFFRTGKQCRERWLNHLDPNKKHGQWTPAEDRQLVQLFLKDGKKWSQVSKKMGGIRTDHMVKNRYKTILSKQKKLFPQISNQTNLLKTFLDPSCAPKYIKRHQHVIAQEKQQVPTVKQEQPKQKQIKSETKKQTQINQTIQVDINNLIVEEGDQRQNKNIPQTSSGFQIPQVFSPWYLGMGISITPTFSPYFMSVPTFSAFEANFNNQFYCPKTCDKNEQN